MEMIGGSSALYLARTLCIPLFSTLFSKAGNRRAFRLRGAGGGSFPLCGGTFARSYSVPNNSESASRVGVPAAMPKRELRGFAVRERSWGVPRALPEFHPRNPSCTAGVSKQEREGSSSTLSPARDGVRFWYDCFKAWFKRMICMFFSWKI